MTWALFLSLFGNVILATVAALIRRYHLQAKAAYLEHILKLQNELSKRK